MSLMTFTGKHSNLLDETPEHCRQLKLPHPILTNDDIRRLRQSNHPHLKVATISILMPARSDDPGATMQEALEKLVDSAERVIRDGPALIILSDRGVNTHWLPIPSLLATAALYHGLLRRGLRGEVGIIVESGEPREIMHFYLLCGYGTNAINPYMAFEAIAARKVGTCERSPGPI